MSGARRKLREGSEGETRRGRENGEGGTERVRQTRARVGASVPGRSGLHWLER